MRLRLRLRRRRRTGSSRFRFALTQFFGRLYRHTHMQRMPCAAVQHAAHGRHVGVVSAQGQRHVVFAGLTAVGRVEVGPVACAARAIAAARQIHRNPGMGSVGADEAGLAGRWLREQVAADIARRQAHRAKARDHDVREVLAYAFALRQRLDCRRVDLGAFGLVVEVAVHALREVHRDVEGRPTGDEAGPCIGREVVVAWHVRRRKDKVRSGIEGRALAVDKALANGLPRQVARHGRREYGRLGVNHAFGDHDQFVVCRIERKKRAHVAVEVGQFAALCRLRCDA